MVSACGTGLTSRQTRYPFAESVLGGSCIQAYIHNCLVEVREGRHTYYFSVFFKRHCMLPINNCLDHLREGAEDMDIEPFRGDILVMRVASKNQESYVNMRERDTVLSDFLVVQCVISFRCFDDAEIAL